MDHAKEPDGEILNRSRIKMRKIKNIFKQSDRRSSKQTFQTDKGFYLPLFWEKCLETCFFNSTAIDLPVGYNHVHRPELDIL